MVSLLPELFDHREFDQMKVPWSKCDVSYEVPAVFRCKEKQVGICEGGYTKRVRE